MSGTLNEIEDDDESQEKSKQDLTIIVDNQHK